ncbi:MAG: hypothetical protein H8E57_03040 [Candidatus Cloacimonetes bacterium]|nr:hypothetical protein [Candidatus Cloacimonadota bacterium]
MKKTIILSIIIFLAGNIFAGSSSGETGWKDGILNWKSWDGSFKTRFDLRMYLDAAFYEENKTEIGNGFVVRRARFAVKSQLWKKWNAEFDIDVANNEVEIKDMWMSYDFLRNGFIKVGNFKPPFSMEELTSSRLLTFLERAYLNCFTPGRRMGSAITLWGNFWHLSSGIFGQQISFWQDRKDNKHNSQSMNFASRIAFVPINNNKKILHFGGDFIRMKPDFKGEITEFDSYPESKVAPIQFVDTDNIDKVDNWQVLGLEGAAVYGPVSIQSEFMRANVKRLEDADDLRFQGFYSFLSIFLTGESRPYEMKEGEFGQVIPNRKSGALEFALRYSHLTLSDLNYEHPVGAEVEGERIKGGKANNITIALNWYANPNVRLMTNYIIVDNSEFADGKGDFAGNDDFNFFQVRLLVSF